MTERNRLNRSRMGRSGTARVIAERNGEGWVAKEQNEMGRIGPDWIGSEQIVFARNGTVRMGSECNGPKRDTTDRIGAECIRSDRDDIGRYGTARILTEQLGLDRMEWNGLIGSDWIATKRIGIEQNAKDLV